MTYPQAYRTIAVLALPLLLGQLGNIAMGFADNIMVGHYSTDALASASFVNNFFNIAIFACVGFTYGLTPLIGALYARRNYQGIGECLRAGMVVNIYFTLIVMTIMTVIYFNLHYLGLPLHLVPIVRPYYLTVLAGMPAVTIFNVLAQWSFGLNNTAIPTWIVLSCNAVNVLGNYVLIYGHFGAPEMGLTGAGISTLASRILTMLAMIWVFAHTDMGRPYRASFVHGDYHRHTRQVATTGFPVAMQMTFETSAFSGAAVIAAWLGTIPLAAFQIVVISGMFGFCLYYSIGGAMAIPVSHAAGRADYPAMRRYAWAGYHLNIATMILVCVLFLTWGRYIMGVFSEDSAVVAAAVAVIVPMVLYQLGDATQITFANALRGTSRVMPMMFISLGCYLVVGLPATYLFAIPAGMGLYGIVLSFSASLFLAAALYLFYFLKASKIKNT